MSIRVPVWMGAVVLPIIACALGCNSILSIEKQKYEAGAASGSGGTSGGASGANATGGVGATGGIGGAGSTDGTGGTPAMDGGAGASGSGGTTSTGGAGGMSGTGGTGGMSATGGTGGSDAGSGDCPTGLEGPALVSVPAPAGSAVSSYCMDATEVTNAQYAAFLGASIATSGQDTSCAWNTGYTPSSGWPATGKDGWPVVRVDWCDAYAYCKWAGKRLCGKIGGGPNAYADYADAMKSEWFNACSAGGSVGYPYRGTYSGTACVGDAYDGTAGYQSGSDVARSVGRATCEGGYPALYDLSGNVWEWEDSCNGATGSSDDCRLRGGSFLNNSTTLRCDSGSLGGNRRDYVSDSVGFRCCSASP